jgi:hypothetical protein
MIRNEQLCSQQMIVIGRRGGSQRLKVTPPLRFTFSSDATFESRWFQSLERNKTMNWKKFVLLGCVVGSVFAGSTATAQMRGHGGSMPRMGMRGAFMPRSMAGMPMQHSPMRNSAFGFHRFNDRDFDRDDGFRRFHRFNDGDFDRDDRFHHFHHFNDGDFDRDDRFHHFHHFHHFNDVIVFDNFGFPFFPFAPFPPFLLFPPF